MLDEKSSNTASVVVLCTAPDEATAQDLSRQSAGGKTGGLRDLDPRRYLSITGKVSWSKNTKCR